MEETEPIRWKHLLGLFVLALVVRSLYLGRAVLWVDEILFAQTSTPPLTPWSVFALHWQRFLAIGHFPFPAMVQNVFLWAMSWSADDLLRQPLLQRIPSVVWGSAAVPVLYVLASRVVARRLALAAALVLTFFYYPFHYSREAYVYAPLLFLCLGAYNVALAVMQQARWTRKNTALFFLCLLGAVYSHMTGVVVAAVFLVGAVLALVVNKYPCAPGDPAAARGVMLRLAATSLAAIVLVSPFYFQSLLSGNAHAWPNQEQVFVLAIDAIGKLFLGNVPAALLVTLVILAAGLIAVSVPGPRRNLLASLTVFALALFLAILVSCAATMYSPRYFTSVAGLLYIVFVVGLDALCRRGVALARQPEDRVPRVTALALALVLALPILVYIPNGCKLTSKAMDYRSVAQWLNANLPAGTPYVFESGYDQRWVPNYFPTPNHVGAVPYVHGSEPDDVQELRRRQQSFFMQFPESCWIEASRHGAEPGSTQGIWEWPYRFFQNRVVLTNEPLQKLIKMRIYPPFPFKPLLEREYITPIWFNRSADVERLWRAQGFPVLFEYDLWACREVNRYAYAHVVGGSWAPIRVKNLKGGPLKGRFVMSGGLAAAEKGYSVELRLDDQVIHKSQKWPGQMWSLESDVVTLPEGQHVLQWGVAGEPDPSVQFLVVMNMSFVPAAEQTPDEAAAPAEPAAEPEVEQEPKITWSPTGN
jgi:hypothetical protein